jgi:cellulose synthase/poly-beta-1,6-N-acetylglucosamine synthase-like glycosyltransferase
MKKSQPKISVIIPVKPEKKTIKAIESLKRIDYPANLVEIFVSYGLNPSRQRNEAAKKAKGEVLYFLDNDSELERYAFRRTVNTFSGRMVPVELPYIRGFSLLPKWLSNLIVETLFFRTIYKGKIGVVGGPNIWDRKESFWSSVAGIILESFFAHSTMAARYRPIGQIHRATEKELILCNLAIKRDVFKKIGGLNESLYPNEENELMNRIEKGGYQLIYHPGVLVFRPRRETFKSLLTAFFHYGRGRMEQIKVEGIWQNLPLLAPLALLGYLFGLFFYCLVTSFTFYLWFALLPLVIYFGLGFGSALGFAARRKKPYLAIFLPFLFLVAHLSYAFGLLYGSVTDLEKKKKTVRRGRIKVERLKKFGESW